MIKNRTSTVPVSRTVSRIEEALAEAGANGINKDYDGGKLVAIFFRVVMPTGQQVSVRLPANAQAVYETLASKVSKPRRGTLDRIREQAERTAWKLTQDWVEIQLSLIQLQKVDFLQVFLPYVWDGNRTFYGVLKDAKFKALLGSGDDH